MRFSTREISNSSGYSEKHVAWMLKYVYLYEDLYGNVGEGARVKRGLYQKVYKNINGYM